MRISPRKTVYRPSHWGFLMAAAEGCLAHGGAHTGGCPVRGNGFTGPSPAEANRSFGAGETISFH